MSTELIVDQGFASLIAPMLSTDTVMSVSARIGDGTTAGVTRIGCQSEIMLATLPGSVIAGGYQYTVARAVEGPAAAATHAQGTDVVTLLTSGGIAAFVAQAAAPASTDVQLDANSLIWSRQYGTESRVTSWASNGEGSIATRYVHATYGGCTWINQGADAGAYGLNAQVFTAPPGCTTATVSFSFVEDPIHAPTSFTWTVTDSTSTLASTTTTPTSSLQQTSALLTGLVPGTQYYVAIFANGAGGGGPQSSFLVPDSAGFTVTPTSGTIGSIWYSTFVRKRIDSTDYVRDACPRDWYLPIATPTSNVGVHRASSFAYVEFLTDASVLGVDLWGDFDNSTYHTCGLRVDVNDEFNQYVFATNVGANMLQFTLPSGMKRVRITNGCRSRAQGTWPRAYYFPATAQVQQAPRPSASSTRKFVGVGDSIMVGELGLSQPSVGDRNFLSLIADSGYIDLSSVAYGGAAWSDHCSTAAAAQAFVQSMPGDATDLLVQLGANDYLAAVYTASQIGTFAGYFFAALALFRPQYAVWVVTPFPETVEAANGVGSTLPQYRTAIAGAAPGSSTVIAGTSFGIVSPGDLYSDGIHLNDSGHGKVVTGLYAVL